MTIKNVTSEIAHCNFCEKNSFELTIYTFLIGSGRLIEGMSPNNPYHVCETCKTAFENSLFSPMRKLTKKREVLISEIEKALEFSHLNEKGIISYMRGLIDKFHKREF